MVGADRYAPDTRRLLRTGFYAFTVSRFDSIRNRTRAGSGQKMARQAAVRYDPPDHGN